MRTDASDKTTSAGKRIPRRVYLAIAVLTAVAALTIVVIGVVVAEYFVSQPSFFGAYAGLETNYQTLDESGHNGLTCNDCHVDSRGILVAGVALVGDFYSGLVNRPDEPRYIELRSPRSDACLNCHNEDWSDNTSRTAEIPHPAHMRVAEETRECVECHKWTAHEEEYIDRHKEMPFSSVCASFECHAGWKTVEECQSCHHAVQEDEVEWTLIHKETVQESGPNGCLETCHDAGQCTQCHTTGVRPEFPEIGPESGLKAIEQEHVKQDWMEQHGEYALDDDSKCFACHVSVGECEKCHEQRPEFHGLESTWLNRHAELAENERDERRCLTCHEKDWCEECHDQFDEMS